MKAMTWEEITLDWGRLQKKHRMEIAQAVARYCIGHKMEEVADQLGYGKDWIRTQLDYAGIAAATGEEGSEVPIPLTGTTNNVAKEVPRLVKEYAPDVDIKIGGRGDNVTCEITGEDAEAFEPYVEHYVSEGHEPAAATRLAKAEWAAESAVEAGVIQETTNKRNERVNQILFPNDKKDSFELDLKMHMARVEQAARFLDEAKISFLRRESTWERVASANEKWVEQVDRVLNLHPTLKQG